MRHRKTPSTPLIQLLLSHSWYRSHMKTSTAKCTHIHQKTLSHNTKVILPLNHNTSTCLPTAASWFRSRNYTKTPPNPSLQTTSCRQSAHSDCRRRTQNYQKCVALSVTQLLIATRYWRHRLNHFFILFLIIWLHLLEPVRGVPRIENPFKDALNLRGVGEKAISDGGAFFTQLDGLELGTVVSRNRNTTQTMLRIPYGSNFWISLTPCYGQLTQWNFKQTVSKWKPSSNSRFILKVKGYQDLAKEPIREENSWMSPIYYVDYMNDRSLIQGMTWNRPSTNRQDIRGIGYLGNSILFVVKGSPGDTHMIRMSVRIGPYASFYGYPRLPASSTVDACWSSSNHDTIEVSWWPANSEVHINYCVAVNQEESLWNRCSAKTRLDLPTLLDNDAPGTQRLQFQDTDYLRPPRISQAAYQCTNLTKLQVTLPKGMRTSGNSPVYINVYAINTQLDISQSYTPFSLSANQIKSCSRENNIIQLYERSKYAKLKLYNEVKINLRQGYDPYSMDLYLHRCKSDNFDVDVYKSPYDRYARPYCSTANKEIKRIEKICDLRVHRRESKFSREKYDVKIVPERNTRSDEVVARIMMLAPSEDLLDHLPSISDKSKLQFDCDPPSVTVDTNEHQSNTYCVYLMRIEKIPQEWKNGEVRQKRLEIKKKLNSIKNYCQMDIDTIKVEFPSSKLETSDKVCKTSPLTRTSMTINLNNVELEADWIYLVSVYFFRETDRNMNFAKHYKQKLVNPKSCLRKRFNRYYNDYYN